MSEYLLTVRVRTNSDNEEDIEAVVVNGLLNTEVITAVLDVEVNKV